MAHKTGFIICLLCLALAPTALSVDSLSDLVKNLSPSKLTETLGIAKENIDNTCLINSQCNKGFFTLRSYCCALQCCDLLQYTFKNE